MSRSVIGTQRELLQQNGDPSSGGGFGLSPAPSPVSGADPPTDSDPPPDSDPPTPIPTQPGIGSGPTDPSPSTPDTPNPGSSPMDPPAGHGSCDFWSSNYGSWPHILSTMSSIISIFGQPAFPMFPSSMTLLQALQNRKTDSYSSLLKQASASLLNAYAYKNFVYSSEDVKKMFVAALSSPQAAAAQASEFERANLGLK
ncbi:hypothetical protein SUGI_0726130 [Cryptomeria japonica]|nr:hypothetical protein SUGI_0726130 [Cryptomeria japonica]